MPPDPVVISFDPHVVVAIECLVVAVVLAVLAWVFGLAESEERRKRGER